MFKNNSNDNYPSPSFSVSSAFFTGGVSGLFYQLGIEQPSAEDSFSVYYKCDILTLKIERTKTGATEKVKFVRGVGGFDDLSVFSPRSLSRKDRDQMIRRLYDSRMSQKQIAEIMDVTQQTVSNVCTGVRCSVSKIRGDVWPSPTNFTND